MRVDTTQMGLVARTLPQPARKATSREGPTPMSPVMALPRACRASTAQVRSLEYR